MQEIWGQRAAEEDDVIEFPSAKAVVMDGWKTEADLQPWWTLALCKLGQSSSQGTDKLIGTMLVRIGPNLTSEYIGCLARTLDGHVPFPSSWSEDRVVTLFKTECARRLPATCATCG